MGKKFIPLNRYQNIDTEDEVTSITFYGKVIWSQKRHGNWNQHSLPMVTHWHSTNNNINFLETHYNRNELSWCNNVDNHGYLWWYLFWFKPYPLGYDYGQDFIVVGTRTSTATIYFWSLLNYRKILLPMPAYWTLSPSSSLSSYLNALSQLTDSMFFTFSKCLEQFKTVDTYNDLMVMLFERQDLIIKTNKMKHLVGLVECFQNEISMLQEYMQESFDTMEVSRLHQLLQKRYVWHEGTMRRQQELCFNLPNTVDRPSTIERPSTLIPGIGLHLHKSKSQSITYVIRQQLHNILLLHHDMRHHHNLQNKNPLAWGCHLCLIHQFFFQIQTYCLATMNITIFCNRK